ncbi:MAG: hypothetical protein V3U92_08625 [Cellulophaga sp.]
MKYIVCIFFLTVILFSCSKDAITEENSLESILANKEIVSDNVIACAASNTGSSTVSIFLYPRVGVSNIQYFETKSVDVDKNAYSNYTLGTAPKMQVLNGYLNKFEIKPKQEKWVIVTFEEEGETHLSNPIRLKHLTKPTEFSTENVTINKEEILMPLFSWIEGKHKDTKIYFEIIVDAQKNLLSGTYTYEKMFQYYKLDNVVLNVTREQPPILKMNASYSFILMGVSEDNWVNLWSEVAFEL